jgi:hypothetical protein
MPNSPTASAKTPRPGRSASRSAAIRFRSSCPCHRIVASSGELGGFSAPGGAATKRRLLTIEDARRDGVADLFDPPSTALS